MLAALPKAQPGCKISSAVDQPNALLQDSCNRAKVIHEREDLLER